MTNVMEMLGSLACQYSDLYLRMFEPNSRIIYLNSLNLSLVINCFVSDEDETVSSKPAKVIMLDFFSKPPLQESYLHRVDPMNIQRQT